MSAVPSSEDHSESVLGAREVGSASQALTVQFGWALRNLRTSVRPEELGLPEERRRTPGIRRQELAALASISTEYVKRLEQNRARPSPQVIASLVAALGLDHTQHEHLSRLAGFTPARSETVPRQITAGVESFVARMSHTPIAVFDAAWTLLAGSDLWQVLFGSSLLEAEGRERNLVWRRFNGMSHIAESSDLPSVVMSSAEDVECFEAALVADLRVVEIRYPNDPFVTALISDLNAVSSRFAALWRRGVLPHHQPTQKTLRHPIVGEVTIDRDVLTFDGTDVHVIVYTAEPGSSSAIKLARLAGISNNKPI